MVELLPGQREPLAALFGEMGDTLVRACLDGEMGRAWADRADGARCARILTGDFAFYAGDASLDDARELVGHIPPEYGKPTLIGVPDGSDWYALLERAHPEAKRFTRYALTARPADFDPVRLEAFAARLPEGYSLRRIDGALYRRAMEQAWSRDFCSCFADEADYLRRGLGFMALYGDEPVAGASSYTVCRSGIEIEIDTAEAHRRKGLARACGSALILECLKRGLYPGWDAANRISLILAQELGYRFSHTYEAFAIPVPSASAVTDIVLRKYDPRDCAEMAQLFHYTVHMVAARDYTREQLAAWSTGTVDLERWNRSFLAHDTQIAVHGRAIVGFGDMDAAGYLDRLYVHHAYQRQGVATLLCDRLEARSTAARLTVHASITARPFFERRGYRVVKEQHVERAGVFLTNFAMEKERA